LRWGWLLEGGGCGGGRGHLGVGKGERRDVGLGTETQPQNVFVQHKDLGQCLPVIASVFMRVCLCVCMCERMHNMRV
jgi:hypothetical protein